MSSFTLEEYRIQRQFRENKRKEYLKRFELLKEKIPLNSFNNHSVQHTGILQQKLLTASYKKSVEPLKKQEQKSYTGFQQANNVGNSSRQLEQNNELKKQLEEIEAEQRKKLLQFKQQISSIKDKYIQQIKSISSQSQKNKAETDEKTKRIMQQMENAIQKNQEIKKVNEEMKKELSESDSTMGSYTTQIKNEYAKKLIEFQKIFNSSNQKIQEMERQFNEEEFVKNALENQDLLKTIQENATKSQEAVTILEDYKELLAGKSQILKEINANIQMKQSELNKMSELEGKMKIIFEKMNLEKKSYIVENQKMTKQLMEVKQLIMGFMKQAEGAQDDEQQN